MAEKKAIGTKDKFELTEKQEAFVEAFLGDCEFDAIAAYKAAGYTNHMKIYSASMRVLGSEAVKRAIHNRMHEATFWLNEGVIIDRLFKEGMTANSASARVNALVWVGKHLGMWKEQEKSVHDGITYNIVNYANPTEEMITTIEQKPEVEASIDKAKLPEGIAIISYKEPKGIK